jgi:predicted AlkP superfamily pyrophosphatase or phosphodiesterase
VVEADSSATPKYLVLITMDGFRPDYLSLAPMHHLRALMNAGTYYDTAWDGQLESTTPASHATIATGVYPRKDDVIGFGWRDPATGQYTYAPTNLDQINAGYLEQTITADGVGTLSDVMHQHNPKDVSVAISGEKYYAVATMGAGANYGLYGWLVNGKFRPQIVGTNAPPPKAHITQITAADSYFNLQDGFAADLAVRMVQTVRPTALMLNLPGTDEAGHYYGGIVDPGDMRSIIRGVDAALRKVVDEYKKLGIFSQTLFVILADHGMVANKHIVPIHPMYSEFHKLAGAAQLDQEYRDSLGSIWLTNPAQARMVAEGMESRHFNGVEGALYKIQTGSTYTFEAVPGTKKAIAAPLLQAYLDLADTEAGPSGADVLLPYEEDSMGFTTTNRKTWGKHGGFSWDSQHIPVIMEGPGIRRGVSHFPAQLVDIAPTIEHLMGWDVPVGVDGVVLQDATNGVQSDAQKAVEVRRMADLKAIRAHSKAQTAAEH